MKKWDQEYIDLIEPSYIAFEDQESDLLNFVCIYANLCYSVNNDGMAVFYFKVITKVIQ
jgi:hypothetical protein